VTTVDGSFVFVTINANQNEALLEASVPPAFREGYVEFDITVVGQFNNDYEVRTTHSLQHYEWLTLVC